MSRLQNFWNDCQVCWYLCPQKSTKNKCNSFVALWYNDTWDMAAIWDHNNLDLNPITIASMPSLLCRSQISIGSQFGQYIPTVVHTVRELQLWSKEIEWRHPSTKGSYCDTVFTNDPKTKWDWMFYLIFPHIFSKNDATCLQVFHLVE